MAVAAVSFSTGDFASQASVNAADRPSSDASEIVLVIRVDASCRMVTPGEQTMGNPPARDKAAGELVDLIASKVGAGRAVHPETAIASAARLAGSLLFRSFGLNIPSTSPGTIVLSNEANEQGLALVQLVGAALHGFGLSLNQQMVSGEPSKCGETPRLSLIESLSLMQEEALQIARSNVLDLTEAAQAAAMATAFIVKECARNIPLEVGFNVAAFGVVEGCKTVPPPLRVDSAQPKTKKPWYRLR